MVKYHGYRYFWMFGQTEDELAHTHKLVFGWCHKPERDQCKDRWSKGFMTADRIRKILRLR
jgi:hypothetical protein